jgi:F0F1-type ATP synthase membrane subunit b/b'
MATNKLVAADSIRTLATRYKEMVEVADLLESIGTIEQASREANAACKNAQEEREAALSELSALKESIRSLKSEYAQQKVDTKADIDLMLSSASEQARMSAEEALSEARRKADDIIKRANVAATAELTEATAKVNAIQTKHDKIKLELDSIVEAKNKAEEEAQEAESKLSSVQAKIRQMASI